MSKDYVYDLTENWVPQIEAALLSAFPLNQHPYLNPAISYHLVTGGKRLRPVLCLAACEQLGGNPDDALPFATAAEVMHNMFLVHDDLEDGDEVRRDQPTLWVKYDARNAINCGDYMIGRAFRLMVDAYRNKKYFAHIMDLFTETYEHTIEGQAADMNMRGDEEFTIDDYLNIIRLKTGYYLGFTMIGAAIIAGVGEKTEHQLREIGLLLGPAFQIRDDVLDLTLGKGRGGMIGCDIREGKPSMLFAAALPQCDYQQRVDLVEIMQKSREETTIDDVQRVVEIYEKHEIIKFAEQYASDLVDKAMALIASVDFKNNEVILNSASYMTGRKK